MLSCFSTAGFECHADAESRLLYSHRTAGPTGKSSLQPCFAKVVPISGNLLAQRKSGETEDFGTCLSSRVVAGLTIWHKRDREMGRSLSRQKILTLPTRGNADAWRLGFSMVRHDKRPLGESRCALPVRVKTKRNLAEFEWLAGNGPLTTGRIALSGVSTDFRPNLRVPASCLREHTHASVAPEKFAKSA